jgi:cell division protein FtsI/penicillin-binding protein 2
MIMTTFHGLPGFAPYEDPQIAISVLIFQGGSGGYGAPVFREIVAEYLGIEQTGHRTIPIYLTASRQNDYVIR